MAANTASAVLVSSNPTNILIAGSFSLNYLTDFTKWTILPSIIPAILTYPILMAMFWKKIPKTLIPIEVDPWSKLRDRIGAFALSALMVITVAVLVGTSFVPGHAVEVWMVTMPAGVLAFCFEVISDLLRPDRKQEVAVQDPYTSSTEDQIVEPQREQLPLDGLAKESKEQPKPLPSHNPNPNGSSREEHSLLTFARNVASRFPRTTGTVCRLPISLLPFAMCEFILVRGLEQRGWIEVFARGFANACTTPAKTVFFMGYVSAAFLCPLAGTNIGATIILVEIMRNPAFSQSSAALADHRILLGAIYSVAMGSNIGAFSYTFAGSLAGLLWRDLLADKGIKVSQLKFARVNALPLLMQITTASAIVLGELYWFS